MVRGDAEPVKAIKRAPEAPDEGHRFISRKPWKDGVGEGVVRAEGRLLLAKLRGGSIPLNWLFWYLSADPLIPRE